MGFHALARILTLGAVGPADNTGVNGGAPRNRVLAPGPSAAAAAQIGRTPSTPPATILGTPTPPDLTKAANDATRAARDAAARQRKRAAAGSDTTVGGRVTAPRLTPQVQPRSLLGY